MAGKLKSANSGRQSTDDVLAELITGDGSELDESDDEGNV